jgi:IPT/TIG domain
MNPSLKNLYIVFFLVILIGCQEEITSREYPRLKTLKVSDISGTGATFSAEVIFRGNFETINYGFIWALYEDPSIDDNERVIFSGNLQTTKFSARIPTTLEKGETYYVKSFIQTDDYMVYGPDVKFLSLGSGAPEIEAIYPLRVFYSDTVSIYGNYFSNKKWGNVVTFSPLLRTALNAPKYVFVSDSLIKVVIPTNIRDSLFVLSVSVVGERSNHSDTLYFIPPTITGFSKMIYPDRTRLKIFGDHFGNIKELMTLFINNIETRISYLKTDTLTTYNSNFGSLEIFSVRVTNSVGQDAIYP